ncbi:MAG: hypothetical protein RLZZ507_1566 [Cyanobacteriota bacterium]|jgi:hypothetical protein
MTTVYHGQSGIILTERGLMIANYVLRKLYNYGRAIGYL